MQTFQNSQVMWYLCTYDLHMYDLYVRKYGHSKIIFLGQYSSYGARGKIKNIGVCTLDEYLMDTRMYAMVTFEGQVRTLESVT